MIFNRMISCNTQIINSVGFGFHKKIFFLNRLKLQNYFFYLKIFDYDLINYKFELKTIFFGIKNKKKILKL